MNLTTTDTPLAAEAADVLSFWLGDGLARGWPSDNRDSMWFGGSPELDTEISHRYRTLVVRALHGELTDWELQPLSRLALVILLDQFTRNIYRGKARAFAGDNRAQSLCLGTLALGEESALPSVGKMFMLMPLMHAESAWLQAIGEQRFRELQARGNPADALHLRANVHAAVQHRAVIDRFGRFPHRNAALGRESTPAEVEFLQHASRFGQ